MTPAECFIALNLVPGLGSRRYARLRERFSTPQRILRAGRDELACVEGVGKGLAERIRAMPDSKEFEQELRLIRQKNISCVTLADKDYPELLKQIYDPPLVLYLLGNRSCLKETAVAVVGSRRASLYGMRQAEQLAYGLALRGICIVSGLARGIDTAAHRGALRARGKTLAVLGSGLDHVYPYENKSLSREIVRNGAVVSEFPLQTLPLRGNFPKRNRIISGLSRGIVVVEAARRSGALITADLALEQGREVFAVPGAANSINAQGTNALIKQGARLIEQSAEIIAELNLVPDGAKAGSAREAVSFEEAAGSLDEEARSILDLLSAEPVHIDDLARQSNLLMPRLSRQLLALQLRGFITEIEGKRFIRKTDAGAPPGA